MIQQNQLPQPQPINWEKLIFDTKIMNKCCGI